MCNSDSIEARGRKLGRALRRSMNNSPCNWEAEEGGLYHGPSDVKIVVIQRRLRFFDTLKVYYNGIEIWMPLLQRLLVRRKARKVALGKIPLVRFCN